MGSGKESKYQTNKQQHNNKIVSGFKMYKQSVAKN